MVDPTRSSSRRRPIYVVGAAGLIAASGWLAEPIPRYHAASAAAETSLVDVDDGARAPATPADDLVAALTIQPPAPAPWLAFEQRPGPAEAAARRLPVLSWAPKQGPPA